MPLFTVRVVVRFEAAHHLTSYKGAPEPVHGHSWKVEAVLRTDRLDGDGMAFDFVEARTVLQELAARFDHRDVNTVPPFARQSPTTARLAAWFFEELGRRLPAAPLAEVTVWEGPDCSATYQPDGPA